MAVEPVTGVRILAASPGEILEQQRADQAQRLEAERSKQAILNQLRQRDLEVRTHEAAHLAAAGAYAVGGPSYTFQAGPDGRLYAVGGGVDVDTSPESTPEETIRKAIQIRAAALAPGEPSGQDYAIAAAATAMEMEARSELQQAEKEKKDDPTAIVAGEKAHMGSLSGMNGGQEETDRDDEEILSNPLDPDYLEALIKRAGKTEEDPRHAGLVRSDQGDPERERTGHALGLSIRAVQSAYDRRAEKLSSGQLMDVRS